MKTMEEENLSELCKSSYHIDLDTGLEKNYVELKKRQLPDDSSKENINPAHEDLVREIALLELDIMCLEKYLLSMYRKTFEKRLESLSMKDVRTKTISSTNERKFQEVKEQNDKLKENPMTNKISPILPPLSNPIKECDDIQKLDDSTILRCHSSLSHAACSFRASPSVAALDDTVDSYHSMPLLMLEHAQPSTLNGSLPEHHVTSCSNLYHNSPARLSEEMIKCISAIYYQLAEPPLFNHDFSSSPISVSSSTLESFPQAQRDMQGHQCIENSSSDSLNNSFHFEDSKGCSGFLVRMVEVQGLRRDNQSLDGVEQMLKQFRYLVSKLEEVAPREMRHDEKLAFWINVHNALVMHAFLAHGISRSYLRRASLLKLKSAYNIGGNAVSVDMIQNSILRCQLTRPGQWIQSLFFTKQRFKAGDARRGYAIEHPDPRLRFALCSGNHSDPVLRLYTSKRVMEELEVAKDDYIQANIRIQKKEKIVLPKNVESYIKEVNLSPSGLLEMIELGLPSYLRKQRKLWKKIDWIPHNFTFRYLISSELVE